MATGSSMTWTYCSDRYRITSRVNRRVRTDVGVRPRGPNASARTRAVSARTSFLPLPPSLALPHVRADVSCVRADALTHPRRLASLHTSPSWHKVWHHATFVISSRHVFHDPFHSLRKLTPKDPCVILLKTTSNQPLLRIG
jgi:hypothetical protein